MTLSQQSDPADPADPLIFQEVIDDDVCDDDGCMIRR